MNRDENRSRHIRYRPLKWIAATVFTLALLAAIGGAVWVWSGLYDVSALKQHTAPIYHVLDYGLHQSVKRGAADVGEPSVDLDDEHTILQGMRLYEANCVQCHGAPGVARAQLGKSMTPVPSNLVDSAQHLSRKEIFWTIRNGIKMTGMPAWHFVFSERELWSITAFVTHMPKLSPADYTSMRQQAAQTDSHMQADEGDGTRDTDEMERGRLALQSHGCTSCHTVEGIVSRQVNTGPPLEGIAKQRYIAGVLPNTFENMVRWIREPNAIDPLTAMPDLDVSEIDAAAMALYLYEQGDRNVTPAAGSNSRNDHEHDHDEHEH